MVYKTKGVCSRSIDIELDGDRIKSVKFNGGCNGNTKGIASLVQGMKIDGFDTAGKTGTTSDYRDGWFCGYTPYYTTAVWVGRDDNKVMGNLRGSTYPAYIWRSFMSSLHNDLDISDPMTLYGDGGSSNDTGGSNAETTTAASTTEQTTASTEETTTEASTTEAPTTEAPTTDAPTTEAPTTAAPVENTDSEE